MIVKYSSLDRLEKPTLTLCNPGSICTNGVLNKVVGMIVDTEAEEIVFNFNATSEFNLRVNRIMREDPDENAHVLSIYKAIQNRRLIFVDDIGYFMITNIEDGFDGNNHYKDVTAKSVDSEIAQKMVPFIENGTYRFLSDNTGTDKGLLDTIIETLPLWTIEHVDSVVAERWRTFEDVDASINCLAFMLQNMQDAYECIFVFNNITRTISVYDQANYVRQTNIHITKRDLINSLDITENADNLFTAISVIGDDNVTISAINPLGTNVIYDFTYYLSWMSDSLSKKVAAWQDAVSAEREHYYNLNLDCFTKMAEVSNLEMEIERLETQITMYHRCRDNIVADYSTGFVSSYNKAIAEAGGEQIVIQSSIESTLVEIDSLIAKCESKKNNNQTILTTTLAEIETIKTQVDSIREKLKMTSYFTEAENAELCHYIFEGNYSDEYVVITDTMSYDDKFSQMKILYDRAASQLQRTSRPTQEFSVDVENFIFIKEFEEWSEQLETGCLINVELEMNDVAALFLSNMTINYDDHSLKMTFGNRFNKFDPKSLYNDVLGKINKSANTLSYIKEILYPIKSGEFNYMKEALQTSRDLTMGQALASSNEEVVIDASGYTGRRLLEDGTYDPRQVKLTGRNLVFTDDAWESCKVALGELLFGDGQYFYGLNAEAIIGDIIMGNNLRIVDKDGNDLLTVMDEQIGMSVDKVTEDVNNELGEIRETISNTQTNIIADCNNIILQALESYVETSNYEEFKQTLQTQLSVMSDQILMNFKTVTEQITDVNGDMQSKFTELYEWIRIAGGVMTFGSSDSAVTLSIENDAIVFRKNGVQFGSWDGDNFYTGNIVIGLGERFQLGNFAFKPRPDESMMLVWVGA